MTPGSEIRSNVHPPGSASYVVSDEPPEAQAGLTGTTRPTLRRTPPLHRVAHTWVHAHPGSLRLWGLQPLLASPSTSPQRALLEAVFAPSSTTQ